MSVRMAIGEALRGVRTTRGMSLSEVAATAGISTATLSRIETGKQSLDVALLVELCGILEVPASHLLGGDGDGKASEETLISALAGVTADRRMRIVAAAAKRHARRQPRHQLQAQVEALLATIDLMREELAELHRQARPGRRSGGEGDVDAG